MTVNGIFLILAAIITIILLMFGTYKINKGITNNQKRIIKNSDLIKNPICPWCKTGKDTLKLDTGSPMCPYIGSLQDGECPFFKPVE